MRTVFEGYILYSPGDLTYRTGRLDAETEEFIRTVNPRDAQLFTFPEDALNTKEGDEIVKYCKSELHVESVPASFGRSQ